MKLKKISKFFYTDIITDDRLCRYRSLFNIIATKYSIRQENKTVKKYYLFKKLILKRIDIDGDRTWECNGKIIKKESLKKLFRKRLFGKIGDKYDDIYFFNSHSGEVYIFLKYILEFLIKKHNGKKPVLVTNQKYHKSIIRMFYPDIDCIVKAIDINMHKSTILFDNKYYTGVVPKWYFKKVDDLICSNDPGDYNYFEQLINLFKVDLNKVVPKKAVVLPETEKSLAEKMEEIKLNLDNFILIIPEAKTCNPIKNGFWEKLIEKYKNMGFDVFVNAVKYKIDTDYKYAFLECDELFALAKKAKRIVALRCGLIEMMTELNVPMDVLYTGFRDRIFLNAMDVKYVMSGFSLLNFPHANKKLIREINAEDDIENIFKKLGV